MAEIGQQSPVVAISDGEQLVLIDGYLRVEALRRLGRDRAVAVIWPLGEADALLHHRHLLASKRTALEDAWLLARLRGYGLSLDELAHRLCRSKSWASRRLALLSALPGPAQQQVRAGTVPPQAAMKYLVPLARANRRQCEELCTSLGSTRVSVREVECLYTGWRRADATGKQRLVNEPLLFLAAVKAQAPSRGARDDSAPPLIKDLTTLTAIAWRAWRRARYGDRLTAEETKAWLSAATAFSSLRAAIEDNHVGPEHPSDHPGAA